MSTLESNESMTAPIPLVYYQWGRFGGEGLGENCATGTIPTPSLNKAYTQEARVIYATAVGPISELATLFLGLSGHRLACRQVSIPHGGGVLWALTGAWCCAREIKRSLVWGSVVGQL